MGEPKQTVVQEFMQFIEKGLTWLIYIAIGVMAKLAFDSRSSQLSRRQIIVKAVLSIFVGYMAAVVCEIYHYNRWAKLAVPVATLLGEGIVVYLMSNWKTMLSKIMPAWFITKTDKKQ